MARIDLIYYEAGGGHRSASTALRLVAEQQHRPWEVRLVDLQKLLDPIDLFRRAFGIRVQDIYNLLLKKGWTRSATPLLPILRGIIRHYHKPAVRILEDFWRSSDRDMVVSVIPHFNRQLWESLVNVSPATPFVTVLTDIADYPPHFWIEECQPQYIICGSERAVKQARELGHPNSAIFRTSGMILHPRFYERPQVDRTAERRRLGLHPDLPTGLVMFGGEGSPEMEVIARTLDRSDLELQLILLCGRNDKLRRRLIGWRTRIPMLVEGFTTAVPYYMQLSDFFIGKPGPGSISEALAMQLPVIVARNASTLPQERYNADWLLENKTGLVLSGFRQIEAAVRELLDPQRLAHYRANAALVENRAVFEITEILAGILTKTPAGTT